MTTVLSFDIGLKRTGVAVGQSVSKSAQVAGQLSAKNGQLDWPQLEKIIQKWQPNIIVVGDPDSKDPHLNKLINRFKHYIQQHHKLPIISISEELTSDFANAELASSKLTTHKKITLRDQIAACLILESYFNQSTALSDERN